jgi:hypothetical protein
MFNREYRLTAAGLSIENNRINFRVEKSIIGYPNLANIIIYNLSETNRKRLETEGKNIRLYAGHTDTGVPLLFAGDIINVLHFKEGPDWKTTLYCGDASSVINTATINKTIPAGTSYRQMIEEILSNIPNVKKGIRKGLDNCLNRKTSILKEIVISGNIKDVLIKLSNDCGFDYFFDNEVFETLPKNVPLSDVPPMIINQASGMIGSPERTEVGVNVKNLLLPELKLGRTIRIESINTAINIGNLFYRKVPPIRNEGVYRMNKLVHFGDTHGNDWTTDIQGVNF